MKRAMRAAWKRGSARPAFYTIEGGGHAWPGGEARLTGGTTPRDFDAAELIWAFFQKHARR